MKAWISSIRPLARVAVAAIALTFVSAPPAEAFEGNACSGCHDSGDLECAVTLSFIIDGCCGNWVDGYGQCVEGYGYAVVCETGTRCMCNSQGQECDIRMSE